MSVPAVRLPKERIVREHDVTSEQMAGRLQAWARDTISPTAQVSGISPMPGNSGYSFGFDVTTDATHERLVIRLPPPGAAAARNSDVLRQAEILTAMATAGIPVPTVRWSGAGTRWFDAPYYVAEFVEGRSTHMFDPTRAGEEDGSALEEVFRDGMRILAQIHQVDWRSKLPSWSTPLRLEDEIDLWLPTLRKADNQDWVALARSLANQLRRTQPDQEATTVVHGDFYSNNWLFQDGRLTAVLDWEIAAIGSPGLDLGWICLMYDRAAWGEARHQWAGWSPTPEWLVGQYEAAGGSNSAHLDWYRALASYRLGCITARAHALHRAGKRHDPAWDVMADSFVPMVHRGFELLGAAVPSGDRT